MRRLVYLLAAERDLIDIFDYLADASGEAGVALRFTGLLRRQCVRLASLPGTLGTARPELRYEVRSFAYKGYVILFRYGADTLEIINIIEGHRDFDAVFLD
jgi:toxin ParE1/3/4